MPGEPLVRAQACLLHCAGVMVRLSGWLRLGALAVGLVNCELPEDFHYNYENYEEHVDCEERDGSIQSMACTSVEEKQRIYENESNNCDYDDGGGAYVEGPFVSVLRDASPGDGYQRVLYQCCYLRRRPFSVGLCFAGAAPKQQEELR